MTLESCSRLTDNDLIRRTKKAAGTERQATTELIVLLAELDLRRLYLGEGCASLFTYCTQVLRLSESEAYGRITAARTARRFPVVLGMLAAGELTLTTVGLLSAHLTDENHEAVLGAAKHQSKREVECLVASLAPMPAIRASVRPVSVPPSTVPTAIPTAHLPVVPEKRSGFPSIRGGAQTQPGKPAAVQSRSFRLATVAPLAADRFLLRATISDETFRKLERVKALLRHVIPDGDLSVIIDRALTLLVRDLERTRLGATRQPSRRASVSRVPSVERAAGRSRHIPAAVRRAVWARDSGRCAFVGREGRCRETGFLEFHHVDPYAAGGPATVDNLELRCRAHNLFESTLLATREEVPAPN